MTTPRDSADRLTYAKSGVNLEAKDKFTESLASVMRRTHGPRVIDNPGGFAGLFRLDFNQKLFAKNYRDPVLVACTDGVGTKVKLATDCKKYDTIGIDLVAMSINDLIVQGAEPLFFLDYIAVSKVDSAMLTDIVKGVADGCLQSGCALLGGETAEMPDVYAPGEFDLAGFAVGVVELKKSTDVQRVKRGDVVLGLESSGVHSNGYSLVRRVVKSAGLDLARVYPELGVSSAVATSGKKPASKAGRSTKKNQTPVPVGANLGEVLLTPTRIYAASIVKLLRKYKVKKVVTGMANITGSGLVGNLERALNPEIDAVIDVSAWKPLPVFDFLQKHGRIDTDEMHRVFNMGVGYTLIVRPKFAAAVKEQLERCGERVSVIGEVVKGNGVVRYK